MIENVALVRESNHFYVEVKISENLIRLWLGRVEKCAKSLSNSELRAVYVACNKQLYSTDANDLPLNFKELMAELTQTMINRKAFMNTRKLGKKEEGL